MKFLSDRAIITEVRQNPKNPKKIFLSVSDVSGNISLETEALDYGQALQARLLPVTIEAELRPYQYNGAQRLDCTQIAIKAIK